MPALADKRGRENSGDFAPFNSPNRAAKKKKVLLRKVSQYSFVYSNACMRAIRFRVTSNSCDLHFFEKKKVVILSTDTRRKQARVSFHYCAEEPKKPSSDEQMSHFVPFTFPLWFLITLKFCCFFFLGTKMHLENVLCTCTTR